MERTASPQVATDVHEQVVDGFYAVDHGVVVTEPPITSDFTLTLGTHRIDADQYRGFLAKRADAEYTTRHLVANFRVDEVAGDDVTVSFTATVHRLDVGADAVTVNVVDVVDVWTRQDGSWRQRARTMSPVFPTGTGGT